MSQENVFLGCLKFCCWIQNNKEKNSLNVFMLIPIWSNETADNLDVQLIIIGLQGTDDAAYTSQWWAPGFMLTSGLELPESSDTMWNIYDSRRYK